MYLQILREHEYARIRQDHVGDLPAAASHLAHDECEDSADPRARTSVGQLRACHSTVLFDGQRVVSSDNVIKVRTVTVCFDRRPAKTMLIAITVVM
jgi:hypothetical protein